MYLVCCLHVTPDNHAQPSKLPCNAHQTRRTPIARNPVHITDVQTASNITVHWQPMLICLSQIPGCVGTPNTAAAACLTSPILEHAQSKTGVHENILNKTYELTN